jgi:hypothetical protein
LTLPIRRIGSPLFNIAGVTTINTSFFVGFCFLDNENAESFEWVLERLRELYDEMGLEHPTTIISDLDSALLEAREIVFPRTNHLLCVWHVFKNVLAHCKAEFKKDLAVKDRGLSVEQVRTKVTASWEELLPDLKRVIYAKTEHEYNAEWAAFQAKWDPQYPVIPSYIYETWLRNYKTMIVTAWTNHILHFGNTATSRAERAHLVIKDALHSSCGDLDTVLDHISTILRRQQEQYRAEHARQAASRPMKLLNPVFASVLERIGHKALFKADEVVQRLRKLQHDHKESHKDQGVPFKLDPCTLACVDSMGIPCIHRIKKRIDNGSSLLTEDFHVHWHLDRSSHPTPLDPRLFVKAPEVMTKGRPRRQKRKLREENTIVREPSKFEIVEADLRGENKATNRAAKRPRQRGTKVVPGGNLEYVPGGTIIKL